MKQRIVLWGALATLAVVAGGVAVTVGRGGDGDGDTPRLPLQLSGVTGAGEAATAVDIVLAPGAGVTYVAGDGMPALGGEAPVHRLAAPTDAEVEDLVEALGIDGPVEGGPDGLYAEGTEMTFQAFPDGGTWSAYRTLSSGDADTPVSAPAEPAAGMDGPVSDADADAASDAGAPAGGAGGASPGVPPTDVADPGVPSTLVAREGEPASAAGSAGQVEAVPPADETARPLPETTIVCITTPCEAGPSAPGTTIPPVTITATTAPGEGGGQAGAPGHVPPAAPCEPGPAVQCEAPGAEPAPAPRPSDLPSEDEAVAIARDLLEAGGMALDGVTPRARDLGTGWQVGFEPSVDGRPAPGLAGTVDVGPGGRVEFASGPLGGLEELGGYPLITTTEAIGRLNNGDLSSAGGDPGAVIGAPEPGALEPDAEDAETVTAEAAPATVTTGPATEPTEPTDGATEPADGSAGPAGGATGPAEPADGAPQPAPMPVGPAPTEVVLTDAEVVLITVPSWDGSGAYLVPGYRFSTDEGAAPVVPALSDDAIEPPADAPGDGGSDDDAQGDGDGQDVEVPATASPEEPTADGPAMAPPAGAAAPTGVPVTVTLTPCGFESLTLDGQVWVVESPPFDEANAPTGFEGNGTLVIGADATTATYTDASGIAVTFTAAGDGRQPTGCE